MCCTGHAQWLLQWLQSPPCCYGQLPAAGLGKISSCQVGWSGPRTCRCGKLPLYRERLHQLVAYSVLECTTRKLLGTSSERLQLEEYGKRLRHCHSCRSRCGPHGCIISLLREQRHVQPMHLHAFGRLCQRVPVPCTSRWLPPLSHCEVF